MSIKDLISSGNAIQNPHASIISTARSKIDDALNTSGITSSMTSALNTLDTELGELDTHINKFLGISSVSEGSSYPSSFTSGHGIAIEAQRLDDPSVCSTFESIYGAVFQGKGYADEAIDLAEKVIDGDFSQSVEDDVNSLANTIDSRISNDLSNFSDAQQEAEDNGAAEGTKGNLGQDIRSRNSQPKKCFVRLLDLVATDDLKDEIETLLDNGDLQVGDEVQNEFDNLNFFA